MKSTYCIVDGVEKEIFKDPKTVCGMPKKSHRGLLMVDIDENGNYIPVDKISKEDEESDRNQLKTVFEDGKLVKEFTLSEIRETRRQSVHKVVSKIFN